MPTEIPDGVCFILSGQPATIYQDQYPQWLSAGTEIECIGMPKLGVSEIKQLILARADNFTDAADELANLIFQKTEGNNLSTGLRLRKSDRYFVLYCVPADRYCRNKILR